MSTKALDESKLQEFIGKVVNEWGAATSALIIFIGDRLGFFKAMAGAGELTPEELAKKNRDASTNYKRMARWSGCWRICNLQYS